MEIDSASQARRTADGTTDQKLKATMAVFSAASGSGIRIADKEKP
jgi:hypothetical protein